MFLFSLCDFVVLQVMTRELDVEMECNLYSPMKMFQEIYGSDL